MPSNPTSLSVPPLRSGGIMLGYRCGQSCRHCNYRCGPGGGAWMERETLEAALDCLAGEKRLLDVHLAGGEATENLDLLAFAVEQAVRRSIRLSYLETNGAFATTVAEGRRVLDTLRRAGLKSILVSVSPYHNESIPLRVTLNCLEAATEVFGQDAVFPWLGHFLPMLMRMDPEKPHRLEEFMAANGLPWGDRTLLNLFPITPGGRVPERLRDFFAPVPAESYRGGHCLEILTAVDHFHLDPEGILFTGHCPGIAAGRIPDLHGKKTLADNPVFTTLALGGPYSLMETARDGHGFIPDEKGYVSPCDLCFQVRRHLFRRDASAWPELGPATFYRA